MPGSLIINDLEEKIRLYRGQQFTGQVKVNSPSGHQWIIYYLLGQIVWIKSRIHALRRWQRQLAIHRSAFSDPIAQPAILFADEPITYASLAQLVQLNQFSREQFSNIIEGCIAEDLFDIVQVGTLQQMQFGTGLIYEAQRKAATETPFIKLPYKRTWHEARQAWIDWQQAGLTNFSPDWAPTITQLETLRAQSPPQTFQTLTTFVDGKTTLRDLANRFKQPIIALTKSVLPYVSRKMLGLIEIPDLIGHSHDGFDPSNNPPNSPSNRPLEDAEPIQSKGQNQTLSKKEIDTQIPRIVYIDDSPRDSRTMCEIVEALGYPYSNIPDPLQALPLLIECKPGLIFLDLVMPIANGYEVCAQIRRISALKEIPIIIVTSNDGIADRVRARLVGASGFLGKPIQQKKVVKILTKHLRSVEVNSLTRPRRSVLVPL
jgi:two-component system, chemotaxis family, response regulator PixG